MEMNKQEIAAERQFDRNARRRAAADDRAIDRMDAEAVALEAVEPRIGEIMRKGRLMFYAYSDNGLYFENAERDKVARQLAFGKGK